MLAESDNQSNTCLLETRSIAYDKEPPFERLLLSNMDVRMMSYYTSRLLWFRSSDAEPFSSERVFRKLSTFLNKYYPHMFGTVVFEPRTAYIDLNQRSSLQFYIKQVDEDVEVLAKVKFAQVDREWFPKITFRMEEPLKVCYVRARGGFGLSFAVNHNVSDGCGLAYLFVQFAEFFRTGKLDQDPFHDRTPLFKCIDPPQTTKHHQEYKIVPKEEREKYFKRLVTHFKENEHCRKTAVLKVDPDKFEKLREYYGIEDRKEFTKNDILVALLSKWITQSRSVNWEKGAHVKMVVAVNGRGRLQPPLPSNFSGNAVFHAVRSVEAEYLVQATPADKEQRREHFVKLFQIVHDSVKSMTPQYLASAVQFIENAEDKKDVEPSFDAFLGHDIDCTNGSRFPFAQADFGCGPPIRITRLSPMVPGLVVFDPCMGSDSFLIIAGMYEDVYRNFMAIDEVRLFFSPECY
jgi:shikimate O-hydroxycinnamoyltransferase